MSSDSFHLSLLDVACLYLWFVMWGGHLSINVDIENGAGQEADF